MQLNERLSQIWNAQRARQSQILITLDNISLANWVTEFNFCNRSINIKLGNSDPVKNNLIYSMWYNVWVEWWIIIEIIIILAEFL